MDLNKYKQRYNEEHYTSIHLQAKPEEAAELKEKAKEAGLSLTRYLIECGLQGLSNKK